MRHYAIPLTYQGEFKLRTSEPHSGNGDTGSWVCNGVLYSASDLAKLPHGRRVTVSNLTSSSDVRDNTGLKVGDVLYINSVRGYHPNAFISCEKLEENGNLAAVNISSNCSVTFKKMVAQNTDTRIDQTGHVTTVTNHDQAATGINVNGKLLTICDLVPYLNAARDMPLEVELVRYGVDHTVEEMDLPLSQRIILRGLIVEPAVYTSVKTSVAPSFHLPMRSQVYVR